MLQLKPMKKLGERGRFDLFMMDRSLKLCMYMYREKLMMQEKRGQANSSVAAPALLIKQYAGGVTGHSVAGLKFNKTAYSSLYHDLPLSACTILCLNDQCIPRIIPG